jgi:flagellar protein FlaG
MTAVSSAPPLSSLLRVAQPMAQRSADGVATVKSSFPVVSESKQATQAASDALVAAKKSSTNPTQEELAVQVQDLQLKMDKLNPALAFVVDQGSGRAMIQLTDRTTKEVIQQFPTEAAMQISKALDKFEKGQLLSRKV